MIARASIQVYLFFVLFGIDWRLRKWWITLGAATTLAILAVHYIPWPFTVSSTDRIWDSVFSLLAAVIVSRTSPPSPSQQPCRGCYFFYLCLLPVATLAFSSVYIPQTSFPVGMYLAVIVVAGLCVAFTVAYPHVMTLYNAVPATALVVALPLHRYRFLPLFITLGLCMVAIALGWFQPPVKKTSKKHRSRATTTWSVYIADDQSSSSSSSDDEDISAPQPQNTLRQRWRGPPPPFNLEIEAL